MLLRRAVLVAVPLTFLSAVNVARWYLSRKAKRTFARNVKGTVLKEAASLVSCVRAGNASLATERDSAFGICRRLRIPLNILGSHTEYDYTLSLDWLEQNNYDCQRVFSLYTILCEVLDADSSHEASSAHCEGAGEKRGRRGIPSSAVEGEATPEAVYSDEDPRFLHANVWNILCAMINEKLRVSEGSADRFHTAKSLVSMSRVVSNRYRVSRYHTCCPHASESLTCTGVRSGGKSMCVSDIDNDLLRPAEALLQQSAPTITNAVVVIRMVARVLSVAQTASMVALGLLHRGALVVHLPLLNDSCDESQCDVFHRMSSSPSGTSFASFAANVLLGNPGRLMAISLATETVMSLISVMSSSLSDRIMLSFANAVNADSIMAVARTDYGMDDPQLYWSVVDDARSIVSCGSTSDIMLAVTQAISYLERAAVFLVLPLEVAAGWMTAQYVTFTIVEWRRLLFLQTLADLSAKSLARTGRKERLPRARGETGGDGLTHSSMHRTQDRFTAKVSQSLPGSNTEDDLFSESPVAVSSIDIHEEVMKHGIHHIRLGGWGDALGTGNDAAVPVVSAETRIEENDSPRGGCSSTAVTTTTIIAALLAPSVGTHVLGVLEALGGLVVSVVMLSVSATYSSKLGNLPPYAMSTAAASLEDAAAGSPLARSDGGTLPIVFFDDGKLKSPALFDQVLCKYGVHPGLPAALSTLERVQAYTPAIDHLSWGECEALPRGTWSIEFRDVSFRYPKSLRFAVSNVSFHIPAGGLLGIIGFSGAGKTTLLLLLSRVYAPTSGNIFICGKPIERYPVRELRRRIFNAWQGSDEMRFIHKMSIEGNVALGNLLDAGDDGIVSALRSSDAWNFVESRGRGRRGEMNIRELSGGELERLSIARGLMKRPESVGVYVFDECTSAVDSFTECSIMSSWAAHSAVTQTDPTPTTSSTARKLQATRVIVSHRLSSISSADEIIVLNGGTVVERGTWRELMENLDCICFHKLLHSQQLERLDHE